MDISINQYLQEKRIDQNLSIQQLAKLSGISASHISRIERFKRNPTPKTLERLATPLNVSYTILLEVANLLHKNPEHDLSEVLRNSDCVYKGKKVSETVRLEFLKILENSY